MRRITFLFVIFLCILSLNGYTQIPEQFNYQAVLRNSSGELISGQAVEVQISIINNNAGGVALYTESHNKTTNAFGLVNLVIGTGTPITGDFSAIDWAADKRFIGVKVDAGSGLTDLGAFQLLSVPYALYASSASNLGSENIYIPQPDTLFAVKDHNGNVVFAVFPDGVKVIVDEATKGSVGGFAVSGRSPTKAGETEIFIVTPDSTRIYVNDTIQSKGSVGGFAVSGRSPTKGINENYLVVTQDSTRIYVNDSISTKGTVGGFAVSGRSPTKGTLNNYMEVTRDSTRIYISDTLLSKGSVGGFAVSGRSPTKDGVKEYFNISGSASAQQILNESRVMWYPEKSALLAGELNIPNADSVGEFSISLGYHNIAKGKWSQAMGYKSVARGDYSTAIGYEAVADTNSFAFGNGTRALGYNSFAFGAKGVDTDGTVLETATSATGDFSFAFGLGSLSSGLGSFVMGTNCEASGDFSTATGFNTEAIGLNSMAMGTGNTSEGEASFTMGSGNTAVGQYSMALGAGNTASGVASVAFGVANFAGEYAIVGGLSNTASGNNSFAIGTNNTASGNQSFAAGIWNQCLQANSAAFGEGNISNGSKSFAIGDYTTASGASAFSSGYHTNATGDYSNTYGYETTASATGSVATGNNTLTTGNYAISAGQNTTAQAYASLVIGKYNTVTGNTSSWSTSDPLFVAGNGTSIVTRNDAFVIYKNGNAKVDGNFYPNDDNSHDLGLVTNRWDDIYATNSIIQTSDKRLKKDINDINYGLEEVLKLRPVTYIWNDKPEKGLKLGLIAQEVLPVISEVVNIGDDDNKTMGIRYTDLIPVLIKSIQEQQVIIDQEKEKNLKLEEQIKEINNKLKELEELIKK